MATLDGKPTHERVSTQDDHTADIVEALYASPGSLVSGALTAAAVATVCFSQTSDPAYLIFALLVVLCMGARILVSRRLVPHGRMRDCAQGTADVKWAGRLAVVLGTLAASILGAMAFYAIRFDGTIFSELATICVALANAIGVVGRSFGARRLVWLQMNALCLPVSLGFLLVGEPTAFVLAFLPLVLVVAAVEIAGTQRRTLLLAIQGRSESERLARQLSTTVETTPNGIAMFDGGNWLRFANARACRVLGIRPDEIAATGASGLTRGDVEGRIALRLEPLEREGPAWAEPEPGRPREFACRRDASRTYRFAEHANESGDTVLRIDDVTALERAERRIVEIARVDDLTGLANRAWFFERAERLLDRASPDRYATVIVVDMEGVQRINDTYGHRVGDAAIRRMGQRLRSCAGADGLCARIGGDEFAVLMIGKDGSDASTERLIRDVSDAAAFTLSDNGVQIAAEGTLGACARPIGTFGIDDLIERAEFARQNANRSAGEQDRTFGQDMEDHLERHKALGLDLPQAIRNGEFFSVFQPIVAGETGRITGFEALARWKHPRFGFVSPVEFIALAEETGEVGAITRLQLEKATQFCRSLPGEMSVSVNISARDLSSGTVLQNIRHALKKAGLAARRLTVEITETSLLELGPSVLDTVNAMRALGVRVSLDDFGTGYSSLSYMQKLHADIVKLDRSFLDTLHEGPRTRSIMTAVKQLAEGLDMACVVEGVETEAQLEVLRDELGFDLFQGYFFARPLEEAGAREIAWRTAGVPDPQAEIDHGALNSA